MPRPPGLPSAWRPGRPISGYNGFDPSGDSLHVGHLIPIFGLLRLQRHGGRPVALVGGGTGMIGDPSGRSSERNLLDRATLEANVAALRGQLERFLDFTPGVGRRDPGQQPRLARRAVADRFPARHRQALHGAVHARQGLGPDAPGARACRSPSSATCSCSRTTSGTCTGRWASSSRWAAPTSGATSRPASSSSARASGAGARSRPSTRRTASPTSCCCRRRGRSSASRESGDSVWLDPTRTTPYAFYQYWLNTDDRDVGTYLRWFTELPREEIEALDAETAGATRGADGAARAGARHHGPDARGGRGARRPSATRRRCSRERRSPIRRCWRRSTPRPAGSGSTTASSPAGRRSSSRTPGSSLPGARPAG